MSGNFWLDMALMLAAGTVLMLIMMEITK